MMADAAEKVDPQVIATAVLTVTRGVTAGWIAGIPQVLVAQVVGHVLGLRERADIGPRFVKRAAEHSGRPLSPPMHWLLGAVFHFEYAASWGMGYALAVEPSARAGCRRYLAAACSARSSMPSPSRRSGRPRVPGPSARPSGGPVPRPWCIARRRGASR